MTLYKILPPGEKGEKKIEKYQRGCFVIHQKKILTRKHIYKVAF